MEGVAIDMIKMEVTEAERDMIRFLRGDVKKHWLLGLASDPQHGVYKGFLKECSFPASCKWIHAALDAKTMDYDCPRCGEMHKPIHGSGAHIDFSAIEKDV
jgi:hypothetical protein